jgi:EAL domain-containing protein (putative c-di-GMP-specific phosphodiesterase class I)
MAHALNLDVVAEGVETSEQLEFLKQHACNIAQGYYFSHPLEKKQIPHLKLVA